MLFSKISLAFLCLVVITSCIDSKQKTEQFNLLKQKVEKQERDINDITKKVEKLTIINQTYTKYLSQINSNSIADIYNTEIVISGSFFPMQNISGDYNLALLSIKYNNLDNALEILKKVKNSLDKAVEVELELQKNISTQINSQADNDATEPFFKDSDHKNTKKQKLSQAVLENGFKPINIEGESVVISPFTKFNKDLVFDKHRLEFFYKAVFEVNYLIGYINYAKKDYKSATATFLINYNIDDEVAKFINQEKLFANVFALAYSFYKINRQDKYCELIKISKVNEKKTFEDRSLYEKINASLPVVSCEGDKKQSAKKYATQ